MLPVWAAALLAVAVAAASIRDALAARPAPEVARAAPRVLSRGVPARLALSVTSRPPGAVRLRQPVPPDLRLVPAEAEGGLEAELVARRRGRHELPAAAARTTGPLGLGCAYHRVAGDAEVLAYPDLPAARRLALAVRQGRARGERRRRGPLGLGTEFESVRDYLPDDDVRQVNWRATARTGRPMSNQYRVEQDRDVICVVDQGRLMGAPLDDLTRLDVAVDAAAAVALVADELGDRVGALAFDSAIRRQTAPRRKGADAVVRALFDVEPTAEDSDYDLAFHTVRRAKRALVFVFTDLLEEAAARPLLEAVPVLARKHAVAVATVSDPGLEALVTRPPAAPLDVYAASVAVEVLEARARVARRLTGSGAEVVEAPPGALGAACVQAYLRAKQRARL